MQKKRDKFVLYLDENWHSTSLFLLNLLNAELNPICHMLALLRAHHILHISRIRVNYPLRITSMSFV